MTDNSLSCPADNVLCAVTAAAHNLCDTWVCLIIRLYIVLWLEG